MISNPNSFKNINRVPKLLFSYLVLRRLLERLKNLLIESSAKEIFIISSETMASSCLSDSQINDVNLAFDIPYPVISKFVNILS